MKRDNTYISEDRRHVRQLFDLISDSEYDAYSMIEGYCKSTYRKRADFYIYGLYERDKTFGAAVAEISPRWLYDHFSPLHETSMANAWDKAEKA